MGLWGCFHYTLFRLLQKCLLAMSVISYSVGGPDMAITGDFDMDEVCPEVLLTQHELCATKGMRCLAEPKSGRLCVVLGPSGPRK